MTKFILTALTASVALGSAAFATGYYYVGPSKDRPRAMDRISTGSTSGEQRFHVRSDGERQNAWPVVIDHGDYFEGANRPT